MKSFIKYGVSTGLTSGFWGIISFSVVGWLNKTFFHQVIRATDIRSISGLFSILILVIGIYWGIKKEKGRIGDTLSFGHAVRTGVQISIIAALIVSIATYIYCTVINPGYADFMVHETQQAMIAAGKSPDDINRRLVTVKKEFSTRPQVAMALFGQLVLGTIASVIIGFILKTKKVNA